MQDMLRKLWMPWRLGGTTTGTWSSYNVMHSSYLSLMYPPAGVALAGPIVSMPTLETITLH